YVAQEVIEAALPGGALYPWRRAIVPVIAAIGGTVGAVAVYLGYIQNSDEDVLRQGWPIACAVDVLFCLAIARGIFRRSVAVTFLLTIAIVSDLIGLAVISQRYLVPTVRPIAALFIVPAIAAAALLRYAGVRSFWPYVFVSGPLIWIG